MLTRDEPGSPVDFAWPSTWYWVKVGAAAACGAWAAAVVLFLPSLVLWLWFITAWWTAIGRVLAVH